MDIGYHHMVLVLLIFFLLYLLIMFFMSLGLHLNYYPLVVSPIPLIVLFLLPKILLLLQDQSSGRMIGTGCESHGLYQLHVGAIMDSPSLIHARLGHPSLAKRQQLVPSLSNVSTLLCESC